MSDKSHKKIQSPLSARNLRALRRNTIRGHVGLNGRIYSHPPGEPKYLSTRVNGNLENKNTPHWKYQSKPVEHVNVRKNTVRGRRLRRRSSKNRHTRRRR